MKVAIGCDHGGFAFKSVLKAELQRQKHAVVDCGAWEEDLQDDYPDFARAVGEALLSGQADRGILACGSGVGAAIAANKIPGIRAGVCHDTFSARQGVEDDCMNVLCLGARVIGPKLALEVLRAFLAAEFSRAERHVRRLDKVKAMEREAQQGRFDRPLHG